jgi:ubiquitin carboxyl-terminal hydrolase 1
MMTLTSILPNRDIWIQDNLSPTIFLFTVLVLAAVKFVFGPRSHYQLLFAFKRLYLGLKDMAFRLTNTAATTLANPYALLHRGPPSNSPMAAAVMSPSSLASLGLRFHQNKPVGLGNADFSCFQNSVIQGLASLLSVLRFLHRVADNPTHDSTVSYALRAIIDQLNAPHMKSMLWLPPILKSMNSLEQQDAQEYYAKILDMVDREVARQGSTAEVRGLAYASRPQHVEPELPPPPGPENPLEGRIAQRVGCLACGHSDGISLIPFNCLTLPLGPYPSYHLSECLDEFTHLEVIDGVECRQCTLQDARSGLERLLSRQLTPHLAESVQDRIAAIDKALAEDDFSDDTLTNRCKIPKTRWASSRKSKQTVIARPPKCLAVHVNRSVFDEMTGNLYKNQADVRFPTTLDLGPWCVNDAPLTPGHESRRHTNDPTPTVHSIADPRISMLPPRSLDPTRRAPSSPWLYELRAAVVHYGRHENGHYVCYRKYPSMATKPNFPGWWELSDHDVERVSESSVRQQGNVFMLFYELVAESAGVDEAFLRMASSIPLPTDEEEEDEGEEEGEEKEEEEKDRQIMTSIERPAVGLTEELQLAINTFLPPDDEDNDDDDDDDDEECDLTTSASSDDESSPSPPMPHIPMATLPGTVRKDGGMADQVQVRVQAQERGQEQEEDEREQEREQERVRVIDFA